MRVSLVLLWERLFLILIVMPIVSLLPGLKRTCLSPCLILGIVDARTTIFVMRVQILCSLPNKQAGESRYHSEEVGGPY